MKVWIEEDFAPSVRLILLKKATTEGSSSDGQCSSSRPRGRFDG